MTMTGRKVFFGLCALSVFWAAPALAQKAGQKGGSPQKYDCSRHTHPDQVADAIRDGKTCREASRIYFACQDRWYNNPDLEEAAVNACDNEFGDRITQKQQDRYELEREACETRYQAPDMRILWSAVRDCKVKLAQTWANRYRNRPVLKRD